MATRKEMNRTSGVARRKAPSASYNDSPFKGSDPLSQVASFAWRLPGAIASGRTLSGRKVTGEEVSGLAASAALAAAGIYAGTRGVRGTRPASGPNAGRSGARPMTTAERSAAVTRAGRKGVGKIGPSTKPKNTNTYEGERWDGDFMEPFNSYESAFEKAAQIFEVRNLKKGKIGDDYTRPDFLRPVSGPVVNTRYKGFTETVNIDDAYADPFDYGGGSGGVDFDMITNAMKKTLDWKATRAPLRRTASTKRRRVGK